MRTAYAHTVFAADDTTVRLLEEHLRRHPHALKGAL